MQKRSVYDLDVFKVAYVLSLNIHQLSLEFPKIEQYGGIADQLRRASKSVCANLVEGLGKEASVMEQRRYTDCFGFCPGICLMVEVCSRFKIFIC